MNNYTNLPYIPQVTNPSTNILYDTTNWILVSGIYQAIGGEYYMTIGNFNDSSSTFLDSVPTSGLTENTAYYYIDDVTVYDLDSIVNVSEQNLIGNSEIVVYPNPIDKHENLTIRFNSKVGNYSIKILNPLGQIMKDLIFETDNRDDFTEINVSGIQSGLYFIEILDSYEHEHYSKKLIIK